jgi:CRP/FNR family cyclic AMP-dependent transcriptional regulator
MVQAQRQGGREMPQDLMPVLQQHPFVAEFSLEQVRALAALARQERFEEGQIIFHEGDDYSVFYLLGDGMVSLELEAADNVLRVQTLYAGDELDWSALLPHAGKHFQARALTPVTALAFEGEQLLSTFKKDPEFGLAFMLRLMGVVSERLRAARVQLLDMYLPEARRAGT